MSNPQLAEFDASLQAIVRRAYDLGRGDALKKVVDVLNADKPCDEPLALMPPDKPASEPEKITTEPAGADTPWWSRRSR